LGPGLSVHPDPNPLGELTAGQTTRRAAMLRNQGAGPITVERVESSCPCVRVAALPLTVGAGEAAPMTVEFDPSEEPEFHGRLSVDLVGREPGGSVVFRTSVTLRVRPGATGSTKAVSPPLDPQGDAR
jgi:hypothetical protein